MANADRQWVDGLSDQDVAFVKRFVAASGSLKAMAQFYRVSYPTVRLRLNMLIQKIQLLDDLADCSAFERKLHGLYADGKIDSDTIRSLLTAYKDEKNGENT